MSIQNIDDLAEYCHIRQKKQFREKFTNAFWRRTNKNFQSKNQKYFNKKKKLILLFWSIIFCSFVFLTINFLLDFNFGSVIKQIKKNSSKEGFLFSLIFAFSYFFISECFLQVCNFKVRTSKEEVDIGNSEWLLFIIISFFIQSITPFAIGAEPFAIWWLNKKGIPLKRSCAIVAVGSFSWFIGQFLVTWPSFIYITIVNWNDIKALNVQNSYWFILVGLCVDIFIGLVIFFVSYSKNVHYFFSLAGNNIKKLFGLHSMTKDELIYKYLENEGFKKIYLEYLKRKETIFCIFIFVIQNLLIYSLFSNICLLNREESTANFFKNWEDFHIINVSTTANNFLPVPSSEGTLQYTIQNLAPLLKSESLSNLDTNIFMWRFCCKYMGFLISLFSILCFGINPKFKEIKQHHQDLDIC